MKQELKQNQKVAYQILSNSLKNNRLAHAYLLSGPISANLKDVAILMVQSIICSNVDMDGFGCEECDVCQRIAENNYADVMVIDNQKESVSKKNYEDIIQSFFYTALEQSGKKVLIINQYENVRIQIMNMILKFIEDPIENTYIFLCTNHVENILPTVISRCINVPFVAANLQTKEKIASQQGLSNIDSHLLSQLCEENEMLKTYEDNAYQMGYGMWMEFVERFNENTNSAIFDLQLGNTSASKKEDKNNQKTILQWFLKIGLIFCDDILYNNNVEESSWCEQLALFKQKHQVLMMINILTTIQDDLRNNVSTKLCLDKLCYLLIESEKKNGRKDRNL